MNKAVQGFQLDLILTVLFVVISMSLAFFLYSDAALLKQALTFNVLAWSFTLLIANIMALYRELNKLQKLITTSRSDMQLKKLVGSLEVYRKKIFKNMLFLFSTFLLYTIGVLILDLNSGNQFIKVISAILPSLLFLSVINSVHIFIVTLIDRIKIDDKVQAYILKKERNRKKADQLKQARSDYPLEKKDEHLDGYLKLHS